MGIASALKARGAYSHESRMSASPSTAQFGLAASPSSAQFGMASSPSTAQFGLVTSPSTSAVLGLAASASVGQFIGRASTASAVLPVTASGSSDLRQPASLQQAVTASQDQLQQPQQKQQASGSVQQLDGPTIEEPTIVSTPPDMTYIKQKCEVVIKKKRLRAFYGKPGRLQAVLDKVAKVDFGEIARTWNLTDKQAWSFSVLALFDTVFFIDDSASMRTEEKGERIEDLRAIITKVVDVVSLFDDDGVSVRFMNNTNLRLEGIASASAVHAMIDKVKFSGGTPIGTSLKAQVLDPLVIKKADEGTLQKPILIICILDGEPSNEDRYTFRRVIKSAAGHLDEDTQYHREAVSYELVQVGRDALATKYMSELDDDKNVGELIDSTLYYEKEAEEYAKRTGVEMTPEMWLLKLCLGAIDPALDRADYRL